MFRRRLLMMMQQVQAIWRTVTRTGTGIIVADDTTEGIPLSIGLQGWTKQDSTTGAQIFDAKSIVKDMVIEQDGNLSSASGYFTSDFIKVNPYTAYYITATGSKRGKYFDENKKAITTNTYSDFAPENGTSFTTFKNAAYIRFSGLTSQVESVMLNEGSVAKPYEPYTGGQPSPSPDYPQDIVNEGAYNKETHKYERTIRVSNKNLFDRTYASNKENWKNGENYPYISIFVGKGNAVSFSYSKELELGLGLYVLISKEPGSTPKSYRWLYHSTTESLINKNGSFMTENDEIYLSVAGANSTLLEKFMENIGNDLQIEISESPTAYMEHAEQTVTITSDRPVSKWDRLEQRDGVYGWVYKTGKLTFDGSQDEVWRVYSDIGYDIEIKEMNPNSAGNGYCEQFQNIGMSIFEKTGFMVGSSNNKSLYFNTKGVVPVLDLEKWKSFLNANNLNFLLETETEEYVPLPEEEQAALKALFSYSPTTVVSNNTGMFMQVEYQTKEGNGEEV